MHMADALLAPAVAVTMYGATAVVAGISVRNFKKEDLKVEGITTSKLPTMAVMSALVFAGQMINYTIPGTGSSGHMCGGMLLSALLGPYAGFLSMIAVLAIQCLFFADGGLMALGANVWNMAFYGCFVGYFLIYRPIIRGRFGKSSVGVNRAKIIAASVIGAIVTLQLGAFSVVIETSLSGITELPFGTFLALMQPIHLAIGLVEGLITAAVLIFVYETRPELLMESDTLDEKKNRMSLKAVIAVIAAMVVVIGGGCSLLASSNPDGLEWSLFGNEEAGYSANMGLSEDDYGIESALSIAAGNIQDKTSILPDYAFKSDDENPAGTSVSGIVGSLIVAVAAGLLSIIGGSIRKSQKVVISDKE